MGETTGIDWTQSTWNPWRGCKKISPGCAKCYMFREQTFYGNDPKIVIRAAKDTFNAPLKWKEPRLVFTCSWSDWFIEKADKWREEAWAIVRECKHTFQILTKRVENIPDRLPKDWGDGYPNVWLGVSIETPKYLYRAEELSKIKAAVRFISYEPALADVDFRPVLPNFQWLISGGESMSNRKADLDWFRHVRDQCAEFGVAYFHKQHGGNKKIDGAWGGKLLDGKLYHSFPKEVQA